MGWDGARPVPWRRLIREWLIYAAIMTVVFLLLFRDSGLLPILGGLFVSGPLYLAIGAVMAKFGYQRKTLADLRTARAAPREPRRASRGSTGASTADEMATVTARARPAPTRRTSVGPNRPQPRKRR